MKKVARLIALILSVALSVTALSSCIVIERVDDIDLHEHAIYKETVYIEKATCTSGSSGYFNHICIICNKTISSDYIDDFGDAYGHYFVNGTCSRCGISNVSEYGLEVVMNDDGESYTVVGIGSCTDTNIIIDSVNGLPITAIADSAFKNCIDIYEITITSNVKTVGNYAFFGCNNLNSVHFNGSLYSIGHSAFMSCTSLATVDFGGAVYEIGREAFSYCASLTKISLPIGIASINAHTFRGCTSLHTVEIPSNVKAIGGGVFDDCPAIRTLIFLGPQGEWEEISYDASTIPDNVTVNFAF